MLPEEREDLFGRLGPERPEAAPRSVRASRGPPTHFRAGAERGEKFIRDSRKRVPWFARNSAASG